MNTKPRPSFLGSCLLAVFVLSALTADAGVFYSDFNTGVPLGTRLGGNAAIAAKGGMDESGVLQLTRDEKSQNGTFIVDDLDPGQRVIGFRASFQLLIGGGAGADGCSFSTGSKFPPLFGEAGFGNGLIVRFRTYFIDRRPPRLVVCYNNATLTEVEVKQMRMGQLVPVEIILETNKTLNISFGGEPLVQDLVITNYQALERAQFAFSARTGDLTDNHWVDDLSIVTATERNPVLQVLSDEQKKKLALRVAAERALFQHNGEIVTGAVYKPAGEKAPYPVVVFCQNLPSATGERNPFVDLAPTFLQKGCAFFIPGRPTPEGQQSEKAWISEMERYAQFIQSAIVWLKTQSFVDEKRIVVMADGAGATAALFRAANDPGVRGLALFTPDSAHWEDYPVLQSRMRDATEHAKAPILMLQAFNVRATQPFFTLRQIIENKPKPNQAHRALPFGDNAAMALELAVNGSEIWADEVSNFIDAVTKVVEEPAVAPAGPGATPLPE